MCESMRKILFKIVTSGYLLAPDVAISNVYIHIYIFIVFHIHTYYLNKIYYCYIATKYHSCITPT